MERTRGSILSGKLMLLGAMELIMVNAVAGVSEVKNLQGTFPVETSGRAIDKINISPEGRYWVFSECVGDASGQNGCVVAKYDLKQNVLSKYVLPPQYLYNYPNFSPDGRLIVLTRIPRHDGSQAGIRQSFAQAELVSFALDGGHLTIYPAGAGRKIAPFMSPDGKKIAFWRAGRFAAPGAKIASLDFDIFEFDVASGQERIFSGPHHFVQASGAQYLTQDKVIVSAYAPHEQSQKLGDYLKKNNYSEVYELTRGEVATPAPAYTETPHAANAAADSHGGVYFTAESPKVGFALCKQAPADDRTCWQVPVALGLSGLRNFTPDPAGSYIVSLYVPQGMSFKDPQAAIAMFNLKTNEWRPISIPKMSEAVSIPVDH